VTTHRRALLARASVVAMLVTAAVALFGTPAFADDAIGVAVGPSTFDLNPSESRDFGVDVNNKTTARQISIVVQSPSSLSQDLVITGKSTGCTGSGPSVSCTVSFKETESKSFLFTIAAKSTVSVPNGQSKQGNGTVTASGLGGAGGQDSKQLNITVRGPQGAPVVSEVSGTVVDSTTGSPIKDAEVTLTDGASASHKRGSDANGRFRFTSTANDPIAPGSMSIVASKDGFEGIQKNVEGKAGQTLVNQRIQLKPLAASASAEPPSTGPSEPAATGTGEATPASGSSPGSGTGLFSWVLIGLGALLVLLGIGAIVLLLVRRKDDEPDDDEPDEPRVRRGPAPAPPSRGGYRAPVAADPTMVAGGRGGAGDATAMIRSPRPGGEYPDPYAAGPRSAYPTSPSPASYGGGGPAYTGGSGYALPAYGAPAAPPPPPPASNYPQQANGGGYGPDHGGGYGGGGGYPSARGDDYDAGYGSPAGYGSGGPAGYSGGGGSSSGGGYSGDPRGGYDEPTGRYGGGGGSGGSGGAGGGYSGAPGYGSSDGYDAGYDRGGHDRRPEYDAGYDRGVPYDRVPEDRGSYGPDYGPGEGYYDDPAATPSRRTSPSSRPDRRSLDWLDD
jgi:Carboxypeptidase regulatory-like domain